MEKLHSVESINIFIKENKFSMIYFSTKGCNVCTALFPKVEKLLHLYPRISLAKVDIDELTEAAGAFSIFTIPCILAYIDGKEIIREARFISMDLLEEKLSRFYSFL